MPLRLAEISWTDARDADIDVAFLPVGSTEQHGPHAPLGTDTLNAVSVAESGADAYADRTAADGRYGDVVVTPPVPIGVAEEHRSFDGTLWVSPDTFRAYARETAESLLAHGVDHVVFVNGHGGNVDALAEVTAGISRDETRAGYAVAFTWFDALEDPPVEMGHAGAVETALLYATHPELVRDDRIEAASEGAADRWGEWIAGVNLAHDSDEFTENGVVGDPSAANADIGAELLDAASEALCRLTQAIVDRDRDIDR